MNYGICNTTKDYIEYEKVLFMRKNQIAGYLKIIHSWIIID